MTDEISAEQARQALDRAAQSASRVRSRASSLRVYGLVNAGGWAASLLAFGFIEPIAIRLTVWAATLILSLAAVVTWNRRRPAQALPVTPPRGGYWAYTLPMCAVEIAAVLLGSILGLHGEPWFWVPASIAVAVPLTVLALWVPRK